MNAHQDAGQGTTASDSVLSLRALYDTIHHETETIDGAELEDAEINARAGRVFEMRDRLSEMPAQTLGDVVLKLRELEYVIREWGLDTQWHEPLLRTVREGAERLAAEPTEGEA